MPFSAETVSALKEAVDSAVANPETNIPGAVVVVIDKNGEELFAHASGERGLGTGKPMTLDSVFWIASCTKMLTGVAVMQLVEQGVLRLDDGDQVAKLCPELTGLTVLNKDGSTEPQRKAITLRHLLTHTAGFGYSFFNERLRDWAQPVGLDEFSGRIEDIKLPLLFQPGEGWEYGVNIDWAGVVLERASGLTLNAYLQKNVLQPLGLSSMSMVPTAAMRDNLAYMHQRLPSGTLQRRDHLLRAPLVVDPADAEANRRLFHSGGAGMFAPPREYVRVLAALLNDGTCPRTGVRLLQPTTVADMFRNQAPQFPDLGRQAIPDAKPDLTNPIPSLYSVPSDTPQGWGFTFFLPNSSATGRGRGTGQWAGLPNLWWWCDRERGVAGLVATQILPFADAKVLGLWSNIELAVYQGLAQ